MYWPWQVKMQMQVACFLFSNLNRSEPIVIDTGSKNHLVRKFERKFIECTVAIVNGT